VDTFGDVRREESTQLTAGWRVGPNAEGTLANRASRRTAALTATALADSALTAGTGAPPSVNGPSRPTSRCSVDSGRQGKGLVRARFGAWQRPSFRPPRRPGWADGRLPWTESGARGDGRRRSRV